MVVFSWLGGARRGTEFPKLPYSYFPVTLISVRILEILNNLLSIRLREHQEENPHFLPEIQAVSFWFTEKSSANYFRQLTLFL